MSRLRILVVTKRTTLERMDDTDLRRLEALDLIDRRQLEDEQAQHRSCLATVHRQLAACHVEERQLHVVAAADATDADLVVTVGGDGTVLASHAHLLDTPVIAVNSDPHRSVGHYTRCRGDEVAATVDAWRSGGAAIEELPRLRLRVVNMVSGRPANGTDGGDLILNDCLFTNQNPAAMTRYRLQVDGTSEIHHSSGVWVSTGAGSTGGIASAGMRPRPAHDPALLYQVREPFFGRGRFDHLCDGQSPPRDLELTPLIPGIGCYIDGCHQYRPVSPGATACFVRSEHPLQLVLPGDRA